MSGRKAKSDSDNAYRYVHVLVVAEVRVTMNDGESVNGRSSYSAYATDGGRAPTRQPANSMCFKNYRTNNITKAL